MRLARGSVPCKKKGGANLSTDTRWVLQQNWCMQRPSHAPHTGVQARPRLQANHTLDTLPAILAHKLYRPATACGTAWTRAAGARADCHQHHHQSPMTLARGAPSSLKLPHAVQVEPVGALHLRPRVLGPGVFGVHILHNSILVATELL